MLLAPNPSNIASWDIIILSHHHMICMCIDFCIGYVYQKKGKFSGYSVFNPIDACLFLDSLIKVQIYIYIYIWSSDLMYRCTGFLSFAWKNDWLSSVQNHHRITHCTDLKALWNLLAHISKWVADDPAMVLHEGRLIILSCKRFIRFLMYNTIFLIE